MEISAICIRCEHYLGEGKCKAFVNIPDSIWIAGNNHKTVLPGQKNNIVFKPIKKKAT